MENLDELIKTYADERLNEDDTKEKIEKKISTAVNKALNDYFHHERDYPDSDGAGYRKVENKVVETINDRKDELSMMIDRLVDEKLDDEVDKAVRRVMRSDLIQNKLEKIAKPMIKTKIEQAFAERDEDADYKMIKQKVEAKIAAKTKQLVNKIKISCK